MKGDAAHIKKFRKELLSGTIALVLLAIMAETKGEMYGYQIAKKLSDVGGDQPLFKQSAIYPVLRSLSSAGFLASRVEPSVSGPPRRYYSITAAGRKALKAWAGTWQTTRGFVDDVLARGIGDD